jgi:hypothetical protein
MDPTAETVTTIDLGYEQLLVFDGGRQARLRVLYGATWLTEEGKPGDAFVGTGGEVALRGGRTVVEGLAPTRLQLVERRSYRPWRRLGSRPRRIAHDLRQWLSRLHLGPASAGRNA